MSTVRLGLDRPHDVLARVLLGELDAHVLGRVADERGERVDGVGRAAGRRGAGRRRPARRGRRPARAARPRPAAARLGRPRLVGRPSCGPSAMASREIAFSVSKTPMPCRAAASKNGRALRVERLVQRLDGQDVADVALVVLEDDGHLVQRRAPARPGSPSGCASDSTLASSAADLAVGHEDDAVHALQHQLAGGVVEDLAGHRVELEPDLHARRSRRRRAAAGRRRACGRSPSPGSPSRRATGAPSCGGWPGGSWSSRTGQDRSTRSWPSSASSCS